MLSISKLGMILGINLIITFLFSLICPFILSGLVVTQTYAVNDKIMPSTGGMNYCNIIDIIFFVVLFSILYIYIRAKEIIDDSENT